MRQNGGYIGTNATPNTTAATGVWTLNEVARYRSAFSWPLSAPPMPVTANLAMWLKADAGVLDSSGLPIATDNAAIATWQDQSGSGRHATQSTSGNRPVWRSAANGQNGLPVVSFNGTSSWISSSSSGISSSSFEYYMTFKMANTNTSGRIIWGAGDRGNFDATSTAGWDMYNGSLVAGGTRTASWVQATATFNGSLSALRINGSQVLSGNTGTGFPTALSLGSNGSTNWANMLFAECLVYSVVNSTTNRDAIEAYLKAKWGTP